jgi:glycosyltransferase involved in cell wall biosynthesis
MAIVPNGIDLDLFRPASFDRASAPSQPQLITIGSMSRLTSTKDVATLIRAVSALISMMSGSQRVRLKIAGDGADRHQLEQLVVRLDLSDIVEFCGTLDEQAVVRFLQGLDIYVQPTKGETLSTAILQAYAVGLPVVASNVEGVSNLVRDALDGILVPGNSPGELAHILATMVADPGRRAQLGAAARIRAEKEFGASLMADGYLDAVAAIDPRGPWRTGRAFPP